MSDDDFSLCNLLQSVKTVKNIQEVEETRNCAGHTKHNVTETVCSYRLMNKLMSQHTGSQKAFHGKKQ